MTDSERVRAVSSVRGGLLVLLYASLLGGQGGFELVFGSARGGAAARLVVAAILCILTSAVVLIESRYAPPMPSMACSICTLGIFLPIFAIMGLSALWSPTVPGLTTQLTDVVAVTALVAAGTFLSADSPTLVFRYLTYAFLITGTVYLAIVVPSLGGLDRLTVLGSGPNVVVRVFALALLSLIFLVSAGYLPMWMLVGSVPFMLGVFLTQSRGGFVSLVAALLYLGLQGLRARRFVWRMLVGIALVIAAALPLVWLIAGPSGLATIQYVWLQRFLSLTIEQHYTAGRDVLTEKALVLIGQSPISGSGLGGFALARSGFDYPHNLVLSVMVAAGLMGACALGLALVVPLRQAHALRARSAPVAFAVSMVIFIFVASMFSGDFFDARFLWCVLALLSLIAQESQRPNLGREMDSSSRKNRRDVDPSKQPRVEVRAAELKHDGLPSMRHGPLCRDDSQVGNFDEQNTARDPQ